MFKHIVFMIIATAIWWVAGWKLMGQDFNLFARQTLPIPIILVSVTSMVVAGLFSLFFRLMASRRVKSMERVLWISWFLVSAGLMAALVLTSG